MADESGLDLACSTKKMGNKTVRWNDGGKLLLRCVLDEEVYKLVVEQARSNLKSTHLG